MSSSPALPAQSWHVVEFLPGVTSGNVACLPNQEPRMLRWLIEPHAGTYEVVAAIRRRAPVGLSSVRIVMDPIAGNGDPLVIHAALITVPPVAQPEVSA